MKKTFVLGALFILPIVAYLFFASGVHNFAKLPVLTKNITDVTHFIPLTDKKVTLQNKITILGFLGDDIHAKKGNIGNLNQKIYKYFYEFTDFQFVMVSLKGLETEATQLKNEINQLTDSKNWNFVFGTENDIKNLFQSLKTNISLDENLGTSYVFIIDKDKNLRGRKNDDGNGQLYGFNATSASEITNKMKEDIKIILAEYRLALKKNDAYNTN